MNEEHERLEPKDLQQKWDELTSQDGTWLKDFTGKVFFDEADLVEVQENEVIKGLGNAQVP